MLSNRTKEPCEPSLSSHGLLCAHLRQKPGKSNRYNFKDWSPLFCLQTFKNSSFRGPSNLCSYLYRNQKKTFTYTFDTQQDKQNACCHNAAGINHNQLMVRRLREIKDTQSQIVYSVPPKSQYIKHLRKMLMRVYASCWAPGKILKYKYSLKLSDFVNYLDATDREAIRTIAAARRIDIAIVVKVQAVRVVTIRSN